MMIISTNTKVTIEIDSYAERHFIKDFVKKYKKQWDLTLISIKTVLLHLDNLLLTDKAEIIHSFPQGRIIKFEFKLAWSKKSAKSSGNRMILYHGFTTHTCYILLVYHKWHIKWNNETIWREQEIKQNCAIIKNIM